VGLNVVANRLVDSTGKTVRLFGVNRSGAEYACVEGLGFFDGPSDAASIAAMVAWHINAVRVPLNEDCWLGINGVPQQFAGSAYQTAIAAYVGRLRQAGLYVILDLHWSAPGQSLANALLPMPDQDHSPTFWKQVAARFNSDLSVLFDLFNEPYPDDQMDTIAAWRCVRDGGDACNGLLIDQKGKHWSYKAAGMQSLVDAVRSTGAENVILSPGVAFSETLDRWLEFRPHDPIGRVAASWHSYNFNTCVTTACWDAQIAPTAAQAPLITGEFGEDDCATGYITPLLAWLDDHRASYFGWAWNVSTCKAGPDLITDYSGTPSGYGAGYRDHLAHHPASPAPTPP
jgi:endoglucanase